VAPDRLFVIVSDRMTAERRYRERAASRDRGHFDSERTPAELWNEDNAEPVDGGWPVIEVDTTTLVEIQPLVEQIRSAIGPSDTGSA
jgi:hypothetical protein